MTAARIGAAVLAGWVAVAVAAPLLPLRDPTAQPDGLVLRSLPPMARVATVLLPDGSLRYAQEVRGGADGIRYRRGDVWSSAGAATLGSAVFPLGTDGLGRDLLSRLVWGARASFVSGVLAALLALVLGTGVGLASGLLGGRLDAALMRATDGVLAIPRLFLLVLLAALFRPSLALSVVAIGATSWMVAARLVRGQVVSLRRGALVEAAVGAGATPLRVALVHLLPAVAALVAVEASLRFGQSVLLEGSLSFLGLGVPPPAPTWGGSIADGRDRLLDAWWIAAWPGMALASVVVATQWVAEGLREKL